MSQFFMLKKVDLKTSLRKSALFSQNEAKKNLNDVQILLNFVYRKIALNLPKYHRLYVIKPVHCLACCSLLLASDNTTMQCHIRS